LSIISYFIFPYIKRKVLNFKLRKLSPEVKAVVLSFYERAEYKHIIDYALKHDYVKLFQELGNIKRLGEWFDISKDKQISHIKKADSEHGFAFFIERNATISKNEWDNF